MAYTVQQHKSDFLPRFITGVIAIPAIIFLLFQHPIYFKIIAIFSAFGIFREWSRMCLNKNHHWLNSVCLLAIIASFIPFLYLGSIAIVLAGCAWLYYLKPLEHKKLIITVTGYVYISLSMGILIHIIPQINGSSFILLILTLVWSVDTGAYITGRVIGGPKLAPAISPKKTWSGLFGGILFGILGTWSLSISMNISTDNAFWYFTIIAIFLSIGGDLLESWCKRYFNVKDTGSFLPGHGGFLDRLDSLLAVNFAAACFWFFCR